LRLHDISTVLSGRTPNAQNSLTSHMLANFRKHVTETLPFLHNGRLLIALSGGLDSMTLAALCLELKLDISIAHCNFGLRGEESDADQRLVSDFANKHGLRFFAQRFDTRTFAADAGLSIQMAARELRYRWFAELLERENFDWVLTAHHADDNLETFLINLSRGSGVGGLVGIPEINGEVVRPLLAFGRREIEAYAKAENLQWREDSSNVSDDYLRNKIRHNVLPALKSVSGHFQASFAESQSHLRQTRSMADDASRLVYKQVAIEKENKVIFKILELKRLPNFHAYLYHWLQGFGFTAWPDVYALADAQPGKRVFAPGYVLLKDREVLILERLKPVVAQTFEIGRDTRSVVRPVPLSLDVVSHIDNAGQNRIFVDLEKLTFPLRFRKWEQGDYFYPFGMKGKKKVSKFFKDEKIPLTEKQDVWILESGGDIVWIVGHRADDRFKVTEQTTTILRLTTS
jgi:tRNA(Ile)-lysidine synthase